MDGEIEEAAAALVESLEHGDAEAAAAAYAENAKVLAPAGELIRGRTEIEGYWRTGIALGLSSVSFERRFLAAVAESVIEVGRYALSLEVARREPVVDRGTYLVVHSQVADDSWRRSVDVFDPDEPAPARPDNCKEEPR